MTGEVSCAIEKGVKYVYVTGKLLVVMPLFYVARQWNSKYTAH